MVPGREKEMVFHQDSASSHIVKKTIDFLNNPKVNLHHGIRRLTKTNGIKLTKRALTKR